MSARLPFRWDRRLRELGKFLINYRGSRSAGLRGTLFWVMGRYSPLLAARYGEGMIIVDSSDEEIGRAAFIRGDYERLYMKEALDYLRSSAHGELGPLFVDVGANIGISTLDALLHFGFKEGVCFEPDSRNYRLLRLNLVLNDLDDRVVTHQMALSDSDGAGVIERAPRNFGDSRLVGGNEAGRQGERETVATRRLDSLIEAGALDPERIGMLWIDTQGYDPFALAGASKVLSTGIPVVVEYWPQALTASGGFDLFEELVASHFSLVVDLRRRCEGAGDGGVLRAADIAKLRGRYHRAELTDLLLLH